MFSPRSRLSHLMLRDRRQLMSTKAPVPKKNRHPSWPDITPRRQVAGVPIGIPAARLSDGLLCEAIPVEDHYRPSRGALWVPFFTIFAPAQWRRVLVWLAGACLHARQCAVLHPIWYCCMACCYLAGARSH